MTVERIKIEINKRWTELANKNARGGGGIYDCAIDELLSLLRFIEKDEDETTRN